MATVVPPYRMPSPLAGLSDAAGTLAEAIIRNRQTQALNADYTLIGDVLGKMYAPINTGEGDTEQPEPVDLQALAAETLPQMKTPQGKIALLQTLVQNRPQPMYGPEGEFIGYAQPGAKYMSRDPAVLEEQRQAGREKLEKQREEARLKIEELRDIRQQRDLDAREQRALLMAEAADRRLEKRLESMKAENRPITGAQTRVNEEISEARTQLDKMGLDKDAILKATQSTLSTGRENPDYNPYIARLVNTARRKMYGQDPDFQKYAWGPTLGPGQAAGGGISPNDLADYRRALEVNKNNPAVIQKIKAKAMSIWGKLPE